jgi:glutamate synthase (NADPH/NADH) large chain
MTGGVAVVLGRTGRNFAAGMSGGIAYVLDEESMFERLCNLSMVEIESVKPERTTPGRDTHLTDDAKMQDYLRHDAFRLRRLIERHLHYTNSARARQILNNWDHYLPRFVKVVPVDFRRALTAAEAAAAPRAAAPRTKTRVAAGAKARA